MICLSRCKDIIFNSNQTSVSRIKSAPTRVGKLIFPNVKVLLALRCFSVSFGRNLKFSLSLCKLSLSLYKLKLGFYKLSLSLENLPMAGELHALVGRCLQHSVFRILAWKQKSFVSLRGRSHGSCHKNRTPRKCTGFVLGQRRFVFNKAVLAA